MKIFKYTLFFLVLFFSCKPVTITKEDLIGSRFAKIAFSLDSEYLEFTKNQVRFTIINDKRRYSYLGIYTIEDNEGKQFVKIVKEDKGLIINFLVKSRTELEIISTIPKFPKEVFITTKVGTIFELDN